LKIWEKIEDHLLTNKDVLKSIPLITLSYLSVFCIRERLSSSLLDSVKTASFEMLTHKNGHEKIILQQEIEPICLLLGSL
jgi:hypothetical protein